MSDTAIQNQAGYSPVAEGMLARDIRALRKARKLTLTDLRRADRPLGRLAEPGRARPVEPLARRSQGHGRAVFGVPLRLFFGHDVPREEERGVVVRAGRRRALGTSESGLVEELLSPDLGGSFEMLRSVFAPGAELETTTRRPTEEAGYVASGSLEIEISGVWHALAEGDSFRFAGKPFRWRNRGSVPAVVIWVVSPPVY